MLKGWVPAPLALCVPVVVVVDGITHTQISALRRFLLHQFHFTVMTDHGFWL